MVSSHNPFHEVDLNQGPTRPEMAADAADVSHALPKATEPGAADVDALETDAGSAVSGNASWPEAAYHTVTAVVGAGVLGLPYAFSYLGWFFGSLWLSVAMATSLYTSWQLASLHESESGIRHNRYRDLGAAVLGRRWSRILIAPFQFCVMVGLGITYTVVAAKGLRTIEEVATGEGASLTKYVFAFGACQVGLSQIPSFAQLWWVSLIGALMSVCYSLLAGIAALTAADEVAPARSFTRPVEGWEYWRGVFNALGAVTFAYGGHSVLLEIQATLRVPPPSRDNMMKGVYVAYLVSGLCYFFVAITGYASYGVIVADDVLVSRPWAGNGFVAVANLMVLFHMLASFQVFTQPVFETVESKLESRFAGVAKHKRMLRATWRTAYVLVVTLVAATLPFFSDLMGLIGATGFTPMTFVMPAVLWLVARQGRLLLWEKMLNGAIVIVFTLVGVLAFVGSCSSIAENARTYETWS